MEEMTLEGKGPECENKENKCETSTAAKSKKKARSTRRRLNAMMNNSSLHFSDTDSEGELSIINAVTRNPGSIKPQQPEILPQPAVAVMVDGVEWKEPDHSHPDNMYLTKERRNSFADNLTDYDEIYASDCEGQEPKKERHFSLAVAFQGHQGGTDIEDLSNDEGEVHTPIYLHLRSDILTDFNGESITTKEGDGPFSMEVRNQMIDTETKEVDSGMPDIVVMPTTDSEDMDASDDDDVADSEAEGACGPNEELEAMDNVLAASQIVMSNLLNVENYMTDDGGISDNHTDVEDLE